MDFSWLADPFYQEYLLEGFVNTLWLVAVSAVGGLMLAVAVTRRSGKDGHHDIRSKDPNDTNNVCQQHLILVPKFHRFVC